MGRFDTLNPETKDLVTCLIPAVAAQFKISDPVEMIPEDIRMRAWDCEKRDHIKEQTEDDPRNWGVQFLKDLMAISRLKAGNLEEFHADLRAKVAQHEEKHPWVRLADIKELKDEYEHPERKNQVKPVVESDSGSSTDSYLEELVEPDLPKGMKRRNHELYEARTQISSKRRKQARLRRTDDGQYLRKEKARGSTAASTPVDTVFDSDDEVPFRRPSKTPAINRDSSVDSAGRMSSVQAPTPSFTASSEPPPPPPRPAAAERFTMTSEPLHIQKLQADLELAEAELTVARARSLYIEAKMKANGDKE